MSDPIYPTLSLAKQTGLIIELEQPGARLKLSWDADGALRVHAATPDQLGRTGCIYEQTSELISRPAWQLRVIEEKRALDDRMEKLQAFLIYETRPMMGLAEINLLQEQLSHMRSYSHSLKKRIARFT